MAEHLPPDELTRYGRQLLLPEIGRSGQERLKGASVLVVGVGGLGSPAALYLAGAGVGRLVLVDDDWVSLDNLQRQVVYDTASLGAPKAVRAAERLRALNPTITIDAHQVRFGRENALDLVAGHDVVLDGTDNFATRYLVNDACVVAGRPMIYGSVYRFEGQVSVFGAPGGPCYRCLFPEPPPPSLAPSCGEAGVLGAVPGVIGTLQAAEAVKWITGAGDPLVGRLLMADVARGEFRTISLPRDPACPVCGDHAEPKLAEDYEALCGLAEEVAGVPHVTAVELHRRLGEGEDLLLLDVRRPHEAAIATLGGVNIAEADLPERFGELRPWSDRPIVVYCRAGVRSARAVRYLKARGFRNVAHLEEGLAAWSRDVDPDLPTY